MPSPHAAATAYIHKTARWAEPLSYLRSLLLDCGLTEALKWGKPCYLAGDRNVAILIGFKDSCALLFFKGALLDDPHGLLAPQGPNSTSGRQLRLRGGEDLTALAPALKALITQAIAAEQAGLKVTVKSAPQAIPAELAEQFASDPAFQRAFSALTPGRQRAYLLHFTQAKQSATRHSRIAKHHPRILLGLGLND